MILNENKKISNYELQQIAVEYSERMYPNRFALFEILGSHNGNICLMGDTKSDYIGETKYLSLEINENTGVITNEKII